MKCIEYTANKRTARLKDKEAHDLVYQGKARYIPKHEYWKIAKSKRPNHQYWRDLQLKHFTT